MEEKNIKQKNLLHGLSFGLLVVSIMFFTFGCKSKDSGNGGGRSANGNYGYGQNGNNGGGRISRVGAGIENSGRYTVILAASTANYTNAYSTNPEPAVIDGEIRVYQAMGCTLNPYMGINTGRYKLVPYQQNSYLQLNMFSSSTFMINAANFQAIVSVPYTLLSPQINVCGYEGMIGALNIESINGYRCGLSTGFTDVSASNSCVP